MVLKKSMGGQLHAPVSKTGRHKTIKVNLTSRQVSNLKNGGAITIKAVTDEGSHELTLPEIDVKKLLTKLNKGVGARVTLNGGSIESAFRDLGKYVQPLSDAAIDRGRRELGSGMRKRRGGNIEGMLRDLGKYVQPLSDAAIDRGRRELGSGLEMRPAVMPEGHGSFVRLPKPRGSGMRKGKGMFDFLNPAKNGATKFFKETLPNKLIDEGIPIVSGAAGSALGSYVGGPVGGVAVGYAGKKAGEEAAREIRKKQGRGVLSDIAIDVATKLAKKAGKKLISYGAKKARQGATSLINRGEAYANEMIGEGIYPAGVSGGGIYPAGVNLKRGGALEDQVIQTGSPYIQISSPAFHPYQPTFNPFTSNNSVQRQAKSGGMIVRM